MRTGALIVSAEGPEEYKHCRQASMATRQAETILAALLTGTVTLKQVQWKCLPNLILTIYHLGREGGANESTKNRKQKGTDPQRSLQCKAVRDLSLRTELKNDCACVTYGQSAGRRRENLDSSNKFLM